MKCKVIPMPTTNMDNAYAVGTYFYQALWLPKARILGYGEWKLIAYTDSGFAVYLRVA